MEILGTEYTLAENQNLLKENIDGVCYSYEKRIELVPIQAMLDGDAPKEAKEKRYREVKRHEIIHAFFNESGLKRYRDDEELVDWIAVQFPKMKKVFESEECLD